MIFGVEVAPGIHRIESPLGARFMAQYVLAGDARTVLVDTGMPDTPAGVLRPYLDSVGLGLEALDDVLISHADNDHVGGNRALRDLHPGARVRLPRARPALGRVERRPRRGELPVARGVRVRRARRGGPRGAQGVVRRRRADRHGAARRRDDQARRRLAGRGPAPARPHARAPRDLGSAQPGRDRDRRGARARHLRTRRDVAADPAARSTTSTRIATTIRRLRALEPDLLLTAHYPVMDAAAARDFLDRSLAFTDEVEAAVREELAAGTRGLWPLTQRLDERLGPYPEFPNELGALVRSAVASLGR